MLQSRTFKVVVVVAIVLVLALGSYAFAASNTVPGTYAGDGQGTISGYLIANVEYTFNASNTYITTITFSTEDIAAPHNAVTAAVAQIQMEENGSWTSCTTTNHSDWSCDLTNDGVAQGESVANATQLRVVAHQ